MKKSRVLFHAVGWILIFCGGSLGSRISRSADAALHADSGDRAIALETFSTHSRLLFRAEPGVLTEWKNTPGGFEFLLKASRLTDLGAPFGYEKEWARQFSDIHDTRLDSISIAEIPAGVKITGHWNFPKGDRAPADPSMERFEFRKEGPQNLVVDFWEKKGVTLAEKRKLQKQQRQIATIHKIEDQAKNREDLRKNTAERIRQAADLESFCRGPATEKSDVFLHFTALHQPFPFEKWFSLSTPDADYHYIEPKSEDADASYVRTAMELYRQGKPALVIRTVDFLDQEYPHSRYRDEMRFLRANALIRLGMEVEAERVFKSLTVDAKGSPVALLAGMYLAGRALKRGESLAALENFLWLLRNYKEHNLNWVFHFGVAEASYVLGQSERAAQEYEAVIQTAPDRDTQAEAALRKGDAYMERRMYEQAIAAYFKGANFYREQADKFDSVHLNRAEALYWLDQHGRAEAAFKDYLEKFPSDPAGWRATYRIAEIYSRRAGSDSEIAAREWYSTTINRFPFSPGALLARLKLVQCGDHAGMDYATAVRLFDNDASQNNGASQVKTDGYADYVNLARVRTMISLGHEQDAVKESAEALHKTLKGSTRAILGAMFSRALRKHSLDLLNDGKDYEALAFYNLYAPSLPKEAEPLVPDFLLRLADAAVGLKLGSMAQKIMDHYRTALPEFEKQFESPSGRKIAAKADPDAGQRIRESREILTEAKALWIRSGLAAEKDIREKLSGVSEESPLSYQKEVLLGMMSEKKGDLKTALTHAMKAHVLVDGKDHASIARVGYWGAQILTRLKNNKGAIQVLTEVEKRLESDKTPDQEALAHDAGLALPPLPDLRQVHLMLAESLEHDGRYGDAARVYAGMMDQSPEDNRILYGYASALRKDGSRADATKARQAFQKAASSDKNDFWKRMAQEALENEKAGHWKPGFADRQGG